MIPYFGKKGHQKNIVYHGFLLDVISQGCPNLAGGLSKPPSKVGHEWLLHTIKKYVDIILQYCCPWGILAFILN